MTTLPLFWHLSSASKKERIDASVKLVSTLEKFQAQFVPKDTTGNSGYEEDEDRKSDGLDDLNSQDVSYSIRRLVRGLASPRESSRLGFAVALTELLSRLNTVGCLQIIKLIMDGTNTQGSMSGQEERDVLFARLFGITAVIQSQLLVRDGALTASGSSAVQASTLSSYEETISQLLLLGEKKSWLREAAWWTISLAINSVKDSAVPWRSDAVDLTLRQLFIEYDGWSPEKVALALKLQNLYPERDWRRFFSPWFKNTDLLCGGNLQSIARILKESTVDDDDSKDAPKASVGSWKPQLHFVWDTILEQLLPGPNSSTLPRGSFQEFFRVVVDESLFSSTSSPERKYWGFQVFRRALPRVTRSSMPMLFTKNFMRSWINHLSHPDRYLHKIARQTALDLQGFVQNNPHLGFALILQLTGVNGSHQFDKLTKTKTIETIIASMDATGIASYIDYLLSQVDDSKSIDESDIQAINTRRSWIIDQLVALIRNGAIPKSDTWIQSILDWLVIHGLFVIKKKSSKSLFPGLQSIPNPEFSDELRHYSRTRLLGCLSDLNTQTNIIKIGDKSSKASAVASDGEFWVSKVLTTIESLKQDTKHVLLLTETEEDEVRRRQKGREVVARLKNISGERQEAAKGAELLLLAIILQRYCTEGDDDDPETLEGCIDGVVRMFPEGNKRHKSRKSASDSTETFLEPIDVLVDTIIGFLEKSTAYLRTTGNQVFALLAGSMKTSTIDLILTQLERRHPAELTNEDDEEVAEDDETNEEEESDEETDKSEVDSRDESNEEPVDLELRNNIEEALRVSGIDTLTGHSDAEDDLMDDEQMMAIDEQLAKVFRSRATENKSNKIADFQREATHFRNRVLDLVDVFVKKQPSSPLIVRLISPLAELITSTSSDERQLSGKAKGILQSRIGKSKEVSLDVDPEQVIAVLTDLHTRARKASSSELLVTFSQCSVYVAKVLLHLHAEESLLCAYRQSLTDFVTRKNSSLNTNFFQDFIRRCSTSAWSLRGDLLDLSEKAINIYRRCQIFQLLHVLVSQLPAMGQRLQIKDVEEFMASLQKTLLDVATSACDDKIPLTPPQLKELFKLGLVAIRLTQRIVTGTQDIWKSDSWNELSVQLEHSARFKASPVLKKMCDQISRICQIAKSSAKPAERVKATSTPKRKAEDDVRAEEAISEKKKIKHNKVKLNNNI